MYYPSLEEVYKLADQGNLAPIYREINADLETPVSAYLKIARPPYSFLLESVEGGERIGRYSFIGTEPMGVIKTGPGQVNGAVDPLIPIEKALAAFKVAQASTPERFNGGMVGYLSYEVANYFERLPSPEEDSLGVPESVFMLTTTFLIFDHLRHKIRVVSHAHLDGDVERAYTEATERIDELVKRLESPLKLPEKTSNGSSAMTANMTQEEYEDKVERVRKYIVAGDAIQVVPSQRLARPTTAHPFEIYRALRAINPSPYMYYLNLDDFQIVGASPEMLVQVENGHIAMHPIAGTRRRGVDEEEDRALEHDLRTSEKEKAERIMLVDLGRNDVGRVSEPGPVQVTAPMEVERYYHVMRPVPHGSGQIEGERRKYDA